MTDLSTMPVAETVLIVEDNGLERFVLAQWLRHHKYKVIETVNGDEALAILKSPIFIDAVVTDIRMPGKTSGIDLVLYINKTYPSMPVIAVSADDYKDKLRSTKSLFLIKPFNLESISTHISHFLKSLDDK